MIGFKRSCKTPSSSNSRNRGEETIPLDLVIEILTRLPVKSIERFRYVSKLWESIVRSLIFKVSPSTVICLLDNITFYFSTPKTQNSSTSTANFYRSFPFNYPIEICRPLRGLLCGLNQKFSIGNTVSVPLICNPSTGQSFTLPKVKTTKHRVASYFGYDPIDKLFKVLCMTMPFDDGLSISEEHQVLTLGSGNNLSWNWRMIKCDIPHYPLPTEDSQGFYVYDGVCINGFLYYFSSVLGEESYEIVCFDIRYEKFKCTRKAQGMKVTRKSILVNYKGKLAMLIVDERYIGIQLWVLEDAENHQWSSSFYVLPLPWKNIYEEKKLNLVGTTSIGEIVLSPKDISKSCYLLYYNLESNTITRVVIQGVEAFKPHKFHIFLDHIEDVKHIATV